MAYRTTRRALTSGLMPEEALVQRALNEYCFEPEFCGPLDWCPTAVLYRAYQRYVLSHPEYPPNLYLNIGQFIFALCRVFEIDKARKTRRWYEGRAVNGYTFVQGPGAIKIHSRRGRPRR